MSYAHKLQGFTVKKKCTEAKKEKQTETVVMFIIYVISEVPVCTQA